MEDHPIFTNLPQGKDEPKEVYEERVEGEKYCKWLTLWCADILLNPDRKNSQPIACIFWGKQGCGKTMLRVLMERLLGQRCVHNTSDPTKNGDILHDFNKTLKYKVFMEFAEINLKVSSTVTDRIKDLITNNTHEIRQMRTDMIRVKATERVLFTTNTAGSVIIEKGDRRFMAVAVSRRRVGDTEYWKKFWAYLQDDSFIKNIADYLLSFKEEVERFAFRDERPITAYYKRLQCMSLSPELDFLKDLFFYRENDIEVYKEDSGIYFIGSTPLLELYNAWRERHSMREKVSIKTFVLKLKSLDTEYGLDHKDREKANGFLIDPIALKETLANDFDIRPDDDQTCLIDLEK
jgi:phage/plasmid-associated DNA primase